MGDTHIEGFELLEKLGEGGSAPVWKARQISLDRIVAIKLLPSLLTSDPSGVERFRAEAQSAAKLKHPGIVQVYDASVQDGRYYIVMEYVAGYTVGEWLRRKKVLPEKDALLVAECVAEALGYAWEKERIVHCDVKPDNVFIDADGTVKVGDLGLARIGATGGEEWADEVMGTPAYISPEQATGSSSLDFRSDIYALGASLYHLVTGRHLFHGRPEDEIMELQVRGTDEDPMDVNPDVSAPMSALIERMLAKNAADRHGAWAEVKEDVARVRAGRMPAVVLQREKRSTVVRSGLRGLKKTRRARRRVSATPRSEDRPGAIWLVLAGITVLVVLFSLAHSCASRHQQRTRQARPRPSPAPVTPQYRPDEPDEKLLAAKTIWESTEAWLKANPDNYDEAMRRLSAARAAMEGTHYIMDADREMRRLRRERQEKAETVMKGLESEAAPFVLRQRFAEAAAVYESYAGPLANETSVRRSDVARELRRRRRFELPRPTPPPVKPEVDDTAAWNAFLDGVVSALRQEGFGGALTLVGRSLTDEKLERRVKEMTGLRDLLEKASKTDERILKSFMDQVGQTVTVNMAAGPRVVTIEGLDGVTVNAVQNLSREGASASLPANFKVEDLSVRERLLRMGSDDQPEVALVKGLMALASAANGHARRYFGSVPDPLGPRLVEVVDGVGAEPKAQPVQQPAEDAQPEEPDKEKRGDVGDIEAFGQRLLGPIIAANPMVIAEEVEISKEQNGGVSIEIASPGLKDISPLAGQQAITRVACGTVKRQDMHTRDPLCSLSDISPLRGIPLRAIHLTLTCVRDISPLRGMSLEEASFRMTAISDISALSGMPLESLCIRDTKVRTVMPVRGAPLKRLDMNGSLVADLSPLAGMQVEDIDVGGTSVQNISPIRNPALKSLNIADTRVYDFMPLKGLNISRLDLSGTQFRDTQVLKGMPIESLALSRSNVSDMRGLAGMPLRSLAIAGTLISDLTPVAGAPLEWLSVSDSRVIDISPVAGAPLRYLDLSNTRVRDLSPIANSKTLRHLRIDSVELKDFGVVSTLKLDRLSVRGAKMKDHSFLKGCQATDLELDLPDGGLRDILLTMPNLKRVNHDPWKRR